MLRAVYTKVFNSNYGNETEVLTLEYKTQSSMSYKRAQVCM